jgi:hypothetical protein
MEEIESAVITEEAEGIPGEELEALIAAICAAVEQVELDAELCR